VRDSGGGIPPEVRARIFEPFFTTKADGLGMVLPISKSIAEAHGGRLEIDEAKGVGAVFRVTFPIARQQDGGLVAQAPASPGISVRREG